jgi:FkbM family methyltransferase
MRSLRKAALERLIARRPQDALYQAAAIFGIGGVQWRAPPDSALFHADAATVELPLDAAITPYVLRHGCWQPEEVAFFGAHAPPHDCVLIDVGANIGLVTRQLMHRLPCLAAAVCFEPHPGNFRMLECNLAHLPNCHRVRAAIGRLDGELRFYEDLENAGNYSLNRDAMRERPFRESVVRCLKADEAALLGPLPAAMRGLQLLWKSDTQGFDEVIMTALPDAFWQRVQAGVMELWRIERPAFDRQRLGALLESFAIRRFGDEPQRQVSVAEILAFTAGNDNRYADLFFARR